MLPPLPYTADPNAVGGKPYRPSVSYSPELAETILTRMVSGESLKVICQDEDMPDASTVHHWVVRREDFGAKYRKAMEARAFAMAEEILDIANTPLEGERTEEGSGPEGPFYKTVHEDMLGHRKLQVDTRKWLMIRMAPRNFGDKITQEHTGVNGAALIPIITVNGKPAG